MMAGKGPRLLYYATQVVSQWKAEEEEKIRNNLQIFSLISESDIQDCPDLHFRVLSRPLWLP